MKALKGGQLWVARDGEIVAGLCLTPVVGGQWLTGVFVDPAYRGQGLAATLILEAVASVEGTVWLLCHPDLEGLYQRMGFTQDTVLPQSLSERLVSVPESAQSRVPGFSLKCRRNRLVRAASLRATAWASSQMTRSGLIFLRRSVAFALDSSL